MPIFLHPTASMAQIPQRCGRGYTKETCQHSPAFGCAVCSVMAANRKTVTRRQYGRRAVYVSGDVIFQDGDAFDLGKLKGGTFSFIFFYFYSMSALGLAYFAIRYTYRTTFVLWYIGLCDIRVFFMHDANQCAWRRL